MSAKFPRGGEQGLFWPAVYKQQKTLSFFNFLQVRHQLLRSWNYILFLQFIFVIFITDLNDILKHSLYFLAHLYKSTGRAIAVTTASVLLKMLKFLVKVFKSLYLLNQWMDLVDTLPDVRYWSEVLCCTIMTHIRQGHALWNLRLRLLVKVFRSLYLLKL